MGVDLLPQASVVQLLAQQLLLVLGFGFLVANLRAAYDLVRYWRTRRMSVLVWRQPRPSFYRLSVLLGIVQALLLVSLVLTAVALAAVGIDVASARAAKRSLPWNGLSSGATSRPGIGSYAGEPDPSGSGAPQPSVKPAWMTPAPNSGLAHLWIQWWMRTQLGQKSRGR